MATNSCSYVFYFHFRASGFLYQSKAFRLLLSFNFINSYLQRYLCPIFCTSEILKSRCQVFFFVIELFSSKRFQSDSNPGQICSEITKNSEQKMESLLELMRRHHEERERLVKLMTEEFVSKKQSVRDQIYSEHRVKALLDVSSLKF